jgi:hypothetical protein
VYLDQSGMVIVAETSPLQATITLRVKKKPDEKRQSFLKRFSLAPSHDTFNIGLLEQLAPFLKIESFETVVTNLIANKPPIKKMADSTFAEIFYFENSTLPVIKILPIAASTRNPSSKSTDTPIPSSLETVLHEYFASKSLASLKKLARYNIPSGNSGFVEFSSFHIVRGPFPRTLIDSWTLFPSNHSKNPGMPRLFDYV